MNSDFPVQLSDSVQSKLSEFGFEDFFQIQKLAAVPISEGKNCRIMAPTGTGKTLSYLLPLGQKLFEDSLLNIVVLASSAELCSQIHTVFKELYPDVSSQLIVGQANPKRQKERLKKQPRFICCTPAKSTELFSVGKFPIKENSVLVIDEMDLDLSGRRGLQIQPFLRKVNQLIVASATYSEASLAILNDLDFEVEDIVVSEREGTIHHSYLFCNDDKKEISLVKLLRQLNFPPTVIFVNDVRHTTHLANFLIREDIACSKLDSQTNKHQREKAVKDLRSGKIKALITSDSLARGMDFPDVHVIQYSIARDSEIFIHRSGRSGRAGKSGKCITLVSQKDALERGR